MSKFINRKRFAFVLTILTMLASPVFASDAPQVLLETNLGNITLELDAVHAPKTVANFLRYVDEGFYNGTVFHRVIKGFMIQGGGMDAKLQAKATHDPIINEADNGLKNQRGTIAMARTSYPHSATSQFFINHADNVFLDFHGKDLANWGYAVFGRVTNGMDTMDKIAALPTGAQDVPTDLPIINRASRINEANK